MSSEKIVVFGVAILRNASLRISSSYFRYSSVARNTLQEGLTNFGGKCSLSNNSMVVGRLSGSCSKTHLIRSILSGCLSTKSGGNLGIFSRKFLSTYIQRVKADPNAIVFHVIHTNARSIAVENL
jgi:hypothetical protein